MSLELIKQNRLFALVTFLFSLVVYSLTVAPTVSYWDCGEFIAAAYTLGIPHPPGPPLFLIVGRVASMFAFDNTQVAFTINYLSVLSSAFTILFMYLSIVKIFSQWKGQAKTQFQFLSYAIPAMIGSLVYAFSHSFWFNAVETEMYAHHMLLTSLTVYITMIWAERHEESDSDRYLLIIAYIIGLSTGIHIVTLLNIPFIAIIYYNKKVKDEHKSFKKMALYAIIGLAATFIVYPGVIKGIPFILEKLGSVSFGLFIILGLVGLTVYVYVTNKSRFMKLLVACVTLVSLGYSSLAVIYIRSNLDPIMDENDPENLESFIKYINREQYGTMSTLPRRWNVKSPRNGINWIGNGEGILHRGQDGSVKKITSVEEIPGTGKFKYFGAQLAYTWNYQINHMLLRYIGWNFIGVPDGEAQDASWDFKQFFALPLLLSIIGLIYQFRKDQTQAWALMAIWIMSGLALQIYLNQNEPQPRERDYTSVAVFYAMSIWVSYGVKYIFDMINEKKESPIPTYIAGFVIFLIVPVNMLTKNYESHDRSNNYVARDYSYNLLQSCEPNAILFTNGDNDTFPIWYLQLVEGVRTDVSSFNLSLSNTPWYIIQQKEGQLGQAVKFNVPNEVIEKRFNQPQMLKQEIEVSLDFPKEMIQAERDDFKKFNRLSNSEVEENLTFKLGPQMQVQTQNGPVGILRVQDLVVLRILKDNNWERPLNFAVTVGNQNLLGGLKDYMRMDGLVYKVTTNKGWTIDPERLEDLILNQYRYTNLNNPDLYLNENTQGLIQNLRTSFIQLSQYYSQVNQPEKAKEIVKKMDSIISQEVIPINNNTIRVFVDIATKLDLSGELTNEMFKEYSESDLDQIWRAAHFMTKNFKLRNASMEALIDRYELNPNSQERIQLIATLIRLNSTDREYVDKIIKTSFPDSTKDDKIIKQLRSLK